MGNSESSHSQHYEDASDMYERNQNFAYIESDDDYTYDPVQDVYDFAEFSIEPVLGMRKQSQAFATSTLFDITAQSIFADREHFLDLFECTGINPFDQLSKSMRVKLIERCNFNMGDFYWEENCNLLLLLMNNKVTGVSFSELPQMSKEAMKCVTDTCFAMTTQCPKLQKFVCTEETHRLKNEKNKGLLLFFGLSLQFAELQVLKICNLECDNLRLGLLAEKLPKLKTLHLKLGKEVTSTGFASLASLEHLEEFLFSDHFQWDPFCSKNRRYYKMCLRLLPWLHFSGYRLKFTKKIYNHPSFYYFDKCRYLKRRMPSQLGLKQISLIKPSRMPVGIALPNLETLFMYRPTHDFQLSTGSLSSLTELSFSQTDRIPMENILSVIGHQLRKLSVTVSDTLHLDSVFRMCPNLQVLYVPECPVDYIGLRDELLNCNLHSMTELCFVEGYDDHVRTLIKPDHLLQILQAAPNLQIFQMHIPIFSEQDGKDFRLALEQHLILQKLEQFSFSYDLPETDADKLSANIGRSVINSIISLCPRLSTANVKNNELKFH